MKTIIIPGYSSKNKEWAYEVKSQIGDAEVNEWPHWKDVNHRFKVNEEAQKLIEKIKGKNIVAKSVGTLVLVTAFAKEREVGKIILCGIPFNDLDEDNKSAYKILSDVDASQIKIFQNTDDEHGSFEEVRRFITGYNPNIEIVEKPGSTHDYPYFEEFKEFLK